MPFFDFLLAFSCASVNAFKFRIDLSNLLLQPPILLSLDSLLFITCIHHIPLTVVKLAQLKVVIQKLLQSSILVLRIVLAVDHALEVFIVLELLSQMLDLLFNTVNFLHRVVELLRFRS